MPKHACNVKLKIETAELAKLGLQHFEKAHFKRL